MLGEAFWWGVEGFIDCTYTCPDGVTPGVASMTVPRQDVSRFRAQSNLILTDGVNPLLKLRDCLLDRLVYIDDGRISLTILDRRWKWRAGRIDGWYNQRDAYPDPDIFVADGGRILVNDIDGEAAAEETTEPPPVRPETRRDIVQLMTLCLLAMGEKVTMLTFPAKLPAMVYPPVSWDSTNPAAALQALAESVGWRVMYRPFPKDGVTVEPVAGRVTYPRGVLPLMASHPGYDPADPPLRSVCVGGPIWITDYLPLEPVGVEANGQIVPIDEMSTRPLGGWGMGRPGNYQQAQNSPQAGVRAGNFAKQGELTPADDLTAQARAAQNANQHIFKTFRVKIAADAELFDGVGVKLDFSEVKITSEDQSRAPAKKVAPVSPSVSQRPASPPPPRPPTPAGMTVEERVDAFAAAGAGAAETHPEPEPEPEPKPREGTPLGRITDRRLIVLGSLCYSAGKGLNGEFFTQPPRARALCYKAGYTDYKNFDKPHILRQGVAIDSGRGLVYFSAPVYAVGAPAGAAAVPPARTYVPCGVWLRVSFQIRDVETLALVAEERERVDKTGRKNSPPDVVKRPELVTVWEYVRNATTTAFSVVEVKTNRDDMVKAMDHYLEAKRRQYGDAPSDTLPYVGLYPFGVGPGVRQVSWSVGGGPPRTTVGVNIEHETWFPDYRERRRVVRVEHGVPDA